MSFFRLKICYSSAKIFSEAQIRIAMSHNNNTTSSKKLAGKVAVITGASRGIGKAVALRLASEGADVAVNYHSNEDEAKATVAELIKLGVKSHHFQADVSKQPECEKLAGDVQKHFGHIDILVSNAGQEYFAPINEIKQDDFIHIFNINVGAQLFMTQAVVPLMKHGGRIVLTSSVSATFALYYHTLYAASKAAVSAMVLNLAPELGEKGIAINAIAPGGTNTDMAKQNGAKYTHPLLKDVDPEKMVKAKTALQRLAEPSEIAAAISFLVSEEASYITGSTLKCDGCPVF